MNKNKYRTSLQANLEWFQRSGVMCPEDGSWGVAERIVLTPNNNALPRILDVFPAHVWRSGHVVLEHRRPDCSMQATVLFFLASMVFENKAFCEIADQLLSYLYCKSGSRNTKEDYPRGVWRWSHDQWRPAVWFDDNAWMVVLPLMLAHWDAGFDRKYKLRETALETAVAMRQGFDIQFDFAAKPDETWRFTGDLRSPHWGSLVCMAFAFAYRATGDTAYAEGCRRYHAYLRTVSSPFTSSEYAYILMGASACQQYIGVDGFADIASHAADQLLGKADKVTGNIPAEWSKEAPVGRHLVDLIYTQNWAMLGIQMFAAISDDDVYQRSLEVMLSSVVDIQDQHPEPWLKGCWRGMYDSARQEWSGGDRFEGGANSIYTGWTNAPLAIVLALCLLDKSLLELGKGQQGNA